MLNKMVIPVHWLIHSFTQQIFTVFTEYCPCVKHLPYKCQRDCSRAHSAARQAAVVDKGCFWLISSHVSLSLNSTWTFLWKHLSLILMSLGEAMSTCRFGETGCWDLMLANQSTVSSRVQWSLGSLVLWLELLGRNSNYGWGWSWGCKATTGRNLPVWEWGWEGGRGPEGRLEGQRRGSEGHTYIAIWTR